MHPSVIVRFEDERGCGRRSPGRMYLVCDGVAESCGKLPIPLEICPCCGMGVKPSRAPQWLEQPERLWQDMACTADRKCGNCPLRDGFHTGPALLIWVGEKYYKNSQDFVRESAVMGISRYIKHVPKGFEIGKTWVLLAHRKSIEIAPLFSAKAHWQQGIFSMFKPTRIEIIVKENTSDKKIEDYISRGLTPVLVKARESAVIDVHQGGLL